MKTETQIAEENVEKIKKTQNPEIYAQGFRFGWDCAIKSIFKFFRVMTRIKGLTRLEESFELWCCADEYTELNGKVVKGYE